MLDFQVRDMLRIKTTPQLALGYDFEQHLSSSGRSYASLTLTMANVGPVSALHTYLIVSAPHTYLIASGHKHQLHRITVVEDAYRKMHYSADHDARAFHSKPDQLLHPGMSMPVVRMTAHVGRVNPDGGETDISFGGEAAMHKARDCSLKLAIAFGCEDMPVRKAEFTVSGSELEDMADAIYRGTRRVKGRMVVDEEYLAE